MLSQTAVPQAPVPTQGAKTAVLVVDDEPITLIKLKGQLQEMGYEVEACESAEEALERFKLGSFDIVLSDVNLPGIDGIEMVRRLRSADPTLIPIVLTYQRDQETAVRALECGIHSFLSKPIKRDELAGKMTAALDERKHVVGTRRFIGDLLQMRSSLQEQMAAQGRKLSDTERYLQHLLDAAPFAIVSTDLDGRVLTINGTAQRLYGYGETEIVGKDLTSLLGVDSVPESAGKQVHQRRDGTSLPVLVHPQDIVDSADETIARLLVVEDRSEREKLEQQLYHSERLSVLGQMAPKIAHEFKTPVQLIAGFSELAIDVLKKGEGVEQALEMLEMLPAATQQVIDMVQQIENLGKPQESKVEDVDLGAELVKILEPLKHLGVVKYCDIETEIAEDLPRIHADTAQIEQVFRNLIINAAHAMEDQSQRRLRLTVGVAEDRGRVTASVADTGTGMGAETLERIFDPFFTTKSEGKGTGLGLPIVKGIVDRHHGEIQVESTAGVGTRFDLSFPAVRGAAMGAS